MLEQEASTQLGSNRRVMHKLSVAGLRDGLIVQI